MQVTDSKVVGMYFDLKINGFDGEVAEAVKKEEEFEFLFGHGNILKSFEDNLSNKKVGEEFKFSLLPEEAYGKYNNEMLIDFEKSTFVDEDGSLLDDMLVLGNFIPMLDEEGNSFSGKIMSIDGEKVKLDFNHPLADKELFVSGEVMSIREATEEELEKGHSHCKDDGQSCGCGC